MKFEWKKVEKNIYQPKTKPEIIILPEFRFFSIQGQGNPNDIIFCKYIEVLYTVSYAVRMSDKKGKAPNGFFEYAVYPLEGVWDLSEKGKEMYNGAIDKNELVFNLMIRQPNFVDEAFAKSIVEEVAKKKKKEIIKNVKFEIIKEGKCVQMLHVGSYDKEPLSFELMEDFCTKNGLRRKFGTHREIYLSDARKTEPDKLKTILRFEVE